MLCIVVVVLPVTHRRHTRDTPATHPRHTRDTFETHAREFINSAATRGSVEANLINLMGLNSRATHLRHTCEATSIIDFLFLTAFSAKISSTDVKPIFFLPNTLKLDHGSNNVVDFFFVVNCDTISVFVRTRTLKPEHGSNRLFVLQHSVLKTT